MLRGGVGLGKTTAIASAVAGLLRERAGARVLVLCPAALRFQWAEMLRREGAPAWLVDRYRFREMLESSAGGELWKRGAATVLTDDFAKQPDIRDSLANVHWDLVVADEAHRFSGARAELLKGVGDDAGRVVLATLPGMAPPNAFSLESVTVVDWRRDELVDDKGKLLHVSPRPVLHEIRFVQSEAEHNLSHIIKALCVALESGGLLQGFASSVLITSLHSSPAALERTLQRFVVGVEKNDEINALLPDEDGGEAPEPVDPHVAEKGRVIAGQALQVLEAIQVDSKLGAFGTLIGDLTHVEAPAKRICVLTDYLTTLYYLAAEVEGCDIPFELIHGSMGRDARQESLRKFENAGGILLATRAVMSEGLNLPDVTDLVLYDVPRNRSALQQVFGRFDRLGRIGRLTIHVLVPEDGPDATDFEPVRLLHEIDLEQQE